jgi:heterogeneous nuclear ribonucleoprotein F/H
VFFQGLVVLDVVVVPVFAAAGPDAKAEAGEAFVVFANPMDFRMALQRDRQTMGGRSIEVYRGKREDYYAAIAMQYKVGDISGLPPMGNLYIPPPENTMRGSHISHMPNPGSRGHGGKPADMHHNVHHNMGHMPMQVPPQGVRPQGNRPTTRGGGIREGDHTGFLRMRGLPFSASKNEISDFFSGYDAILDSIVLTSRSDGRATGEAYVAFETSEKSKEAMGLHRSTMGSRYIELFISNKDEHARAMARMNNR